MKQHITEEQLKELSESEKDRLITWYEDHKGTFFMSTSEILIDGKFLPQLSIGEMIEFLTEHYEPYKSWLDLFIEGEIYDNETPDWKEAEPIDVLWEAVKEVLTITQSSS